MNIQTFAPEIIPFILLLVEQSEDVFWIRSPDYSKQLYISPAYESVWGRSCEKLYKDPEEWSKTIHPDDLKYLLDSVKKRKPNFQPGETFNETYRIIRPNGEIRWIHDKSVPIYNEAGVHIGFAGIAHDITEVKEAEELRTKNKVLEEQEQTTRLLAASMAHELRTPLRAIESGATGIENYLPEMFDAYKIAKNAGLEIPFIAPMQFKSLSKIIEHIKIETRASFAVIDMLLMNTNSSAIDESKFKIHSMGQCIKDALLRYPLDDEEKSKIHWKKCDFSYHGDDTLMTHVIFNLLKNALHYLQAANKGEIQIWCDQNENFNILHFKDTSAGIDADILPHIFDRFYSRTRHGTGVGLAFCKLVMKSFGGDITCQSIKGEYSDFQLFFPRQDD